MRRQFFGHGYFHADPHPGNLLVTPRGELVYLDFGMMGERPLPREPSERRGSAVTFVVVTRDTPDATPHRYARGEDSPREPSERRGFAITLSWLQETLLT